MEQATFIQILLAVAGVALMSVTVLVAVAAIGGWFWFNRVAQQKAERVAQQAISKYLSESKIREMLQKEVVREADGLYSDMAMSPDHNFDDLASSDKGKEKNNE